MFYIAFAFAIVASLLVLACGVLTVIDYGIKVAGNLRAYRSDH